MRGPTRETAQQIADTYVRLANEARYRPCAPSDGFGNITVSTAGLDLRAEALAYIDQWHAEENEGRYSAGCPAWSDRPALIFLVEAARVLNGGNRKLAARLADMAKHRIEHTAA